MAVTFLLKSGPNWGGQHAPYYPIAFLKRKGRISNAEYQELSGVTDRTALRHLKDLAQKGLIEKTGLTGRSVHYRISRRKPDINPTNPT